LKTEIWSPNRTIKELKRDHVLHHEGDEFTPNRTIKELKLDTETAEDCFYALPIAPLRN